MYPSILFLSDLKPKDYYILQMGKLRYKEFR